MFPVCTFEHIEIGEANELLVKWKHKMGPLNRPLYGQNTAHALTHNGRPVAVTILSGLISPTIGNGCDYLTRENTCELSRLCAERPGLCRVAIRLWREFVFAESGFEYAISYSDNDLHNGNTYRFDGWKIVVKNARSGTDQRSGRKGRDKTVWQWPPPAPPT